MKRLLTTGLSMLTLLIVAAPATLAETHREMSRTVAENPFDLQRLNPYDHPPAPATVRSWRQSSEQPIAKSETVLLPERQRESKFQPVQMAGFQASASSQFLSPNSLVSAAYQGRLQSQGIPSAAALANGQASGRITAERLVTAAIREGKLSTQALSNPAYLNLVETKLADLNRG